MSGVVQIDPDQRVYFKLEATITRRAMLRIQAFMLDGASGSVQLNIKDGEILGVHINEVLVAPSSQSKRSRTA